MIRQGRASAFLLLLNFGGLRPPPKKCFREGKKTEKKNCYLYIPDEKSHGLGTQREPCKNNGLFPTILG